MKTLLKCGRITLSAIVFLMIGTLVFAQGAIDMSFGKSGKVITKFSKNRDDIGQSVVVQSDGKIISIGNSFDLVGQSNIGVVRYNTNGKIDKTFNGTGKKVINNAFCNVVRVQTDGKIVIGGSVAKGSSTLFGVWRLNSDGSNDNSFGTNGFVSVPFTGYVICFAMTLQNDGKILLGGNDGNFYSGNSSLILARLNPNGSLDNSFDNDGKFSYNLTRKSLTCNEILLQSDGKIIATGQLDTVKDPNFINEYYAMRLNANGTVDGSFGTGGYVRAKATTSDVAYSAALLPDGRIIMSGISDFGSYSRGSVLALKNNGTIDNSFGTNGWVYPDFYGGTALFQATLAQANGKVIVAGYDYNTNATSSVCLARLNGNGTLDVGFANAGRDTFFNVPTGMIACNAAVMQSNGNIVVNGWQLNNNLYYLMTARFLNAPQFQRAQSAMTNPVISELSLFPIPVVSNSARLVFTLTNPSDVVISVYDLTGREVIPPIHTSFNSGKAEQILSLPGNLSSGTYVCSVQIADAVRTVKFEVNKH